MAYEKAGVELELSKAEAYISSAKQAAAATDLLYSSISKMGGVNISSLNAFSSTMKDLVKVGQDAGKSAKEAATQIVEVGTKAGASSNHFGDLIGKVKDVTGGFLSLGGSAVSNLVKGLGDIGSMGVSAAKALLDVGSAAAGAAWSGISKLGSMAVDAGKGLVELGVKAAEAGAKFAISFGKDAVKAAMDFDKQMSEVAAVSSATPEQLKKMSDEALRLGAVFPVSATDAAKAMTELGKAGFNTDQILAASVGTVQLASATHYSMADSATVLANAINQFGLKASDASRVTDLFAAAANSSAVDVKDLAKTFEYVGPVAQAAGFSIEDVAKATAVMGNAGIKGSSAGTGLKAVLSSLIAPSDKAAAAFETLGFKSTDANGKIRPLQDQLVDLRSKFKGLSSQEQVDLATKIVGVNHFSKLLAVMNATDDSFNQVSDSIDKADGAGQRMAATMNDNLAGAVENLKGSFETLQIKVGKAFEPILKDLANFGSMLIGKVIPYVDVFAKKFIDTTNKIKGSIVDITKGWSLFVAGFNGQNIMMPKGFTSIMDKMALLGQALAPLKQAFSDLITAIMPEPALKFADSIGGVAAKAKDAHPVIDAISSLVKNVLVPGIEGAARTIDNLQIAFGKAKDAITPFLPTIGDLAKKAWDIYQAVSPLNIALDVFNGFMTGGLGGAVDAVGQHVTDLGNAFGVDLSEPVKTVTDFLKNDLVPGIEGIVKSVSDALPGIIAFGQSFLDTVLPPIQSFVGWVVTNVGPMVSSAFDTFQKDVLPALGRFVDYVGTTLIPKISDFVSAIADKVKPILETGFSIITTTVIPTIGKLVAVITDDVIPILTDWWGVIATVLTPVFDVIVGAINTVFLPAIKAIWGFINDPLIPIFKTIADVMKTTVIPAFQAVADFFNKTVHDAIQTVIDVWNGLMDKIKGSADVLGKVATGDWKGAWDLMTKTTKDGVVSSTFEVDKLATSVGGKDYSAPAAKAGATIGTGLASGIDSMAWKVSAAAAAIASKAINAARQTLSSASPSKVFIEIGHNVGDGFSIGIEDKIPVVAGSMVDLVGNMNKVIKDQSPNLKETVDQFLLPISKMPFYLDHQNPVIGRSLIDVWENLALVTDMKSGLVNDAIGRLLQPIKDAAGEIGSLIGTNQDPATPIGQIADHIGTIIGNAARKFGGDIDAYVENLRRLRAALDATIANWPAMPGPATSGAGGTPLPGQGASNMPLPTGGGQFVFASGTSFFKGGPAIVGEAGAELIRTLSGKLSLVTAPTLFPNLERGSRIYDPAQTRQILANPASAQQISNMYQNSYSNAPVVNNNYNQTYQMPLNVAPMQLGAIQQGYAHARAMIPV